ncbi:UDP-2,4-diacetamido-2,4,6-trideoxy-beta-L-altropyranose hydrolase [Pedobacter insulae]|uniref:UDP-2,4-diacetamido-2,4,6-trideoxy-beta-L-altropyranose hydrolase n=1 Tax=Pedobacter insulae TaxID=414048 RepID=A0A1I2TCE6_9SPHI|nr:UDP-2,4-diacetamido-2,4,6-trideoxy-beta-L-altropyranose hydrolase [Pedobacter insulae]SFG62572.1 UDP-2,4-diacetamido-2,4,6-trideoxy-beta-L-altropyranose hydrolase [Pedobacter insulae]
MKTKVYIRVDGNGDIGLGHLVRCIALGQMLKNGFKIYFFCKEVPETIISDIIANQFEFFKIREESEFLAILEGNEMVVLDNYFFEPSYQEQIKNLAGKLICIDDLHDKKFYADLIINHAPDTKANEYDAMLYTQFALGLEYALLRSFFLEQAKIGRQTNLIESVVICFGGSDPNNLTCKTLKVVLKEARIKKVSVIIGSAYRFRNDLINISSRYPHTSVFTAVSEEQMLKLMSTSDLAIVPSSGILLEALATGCRVISGIYTENQKFIFSQYKEAGFFVSAEDFSTMNIENALRTVLAKEGSAYKSLKIDGCSGERIFRIFNQLKLENEVELRYAEPDDLTITFNWAKDPIIRAFSFNRNEIKYSEHENWYLSKIKDNKCKFFIAQRNSEKLGSIRFDIEKGRAVISFLVDPKYHGLGLGQILLKKGLDKLIDEDLTINSVVGYVMPDNLASVKAFERLGYTKTIHNSNFEFIKLLNQQ